MTHVTLSGLATHAVDVQCVGGHLAVQARSTVLVDQIQLTSSSRLPVVVEASNRSQSEVRRLSLESPSESEL